LRVKISNQKVEIANIDDPNEILELQVRAYQSEGEIHNDYSIEPLIETPLELQEQFKHKTFLKAVLEGRIVGSVRGDTIFYQSIFKFKTQA
jgi:hypothetical protein